MPIAGGGNLYIGQRGDMVSQFNGRLDEAYVFARALSAEEILTLYERCEPRAVETVGKLAISWASIKAQ